MRFFPLILCALLSSAVSDAQRHLLLKGDELPPSVGIDQEFGNGSERQQALNELVHLSWKGGYLSASIDSTRSTGDTLIAWYHRGPRFEWGKLEIAEKGEGLIHDAGVKPERWKGKELDPEELSQLLEKILEHCERNGYPFAELALDSLRAEGRGIEGELKLDKGPLVRLDTIMVEGDDVVHPSYLEQYLGLREGMIYDERRFQRIDERMRNLSILDPQGPSQLLFTEDGVTVYLYIKERSASRFNGMLGLQPGDGEDEFIITGDLTLGLKNALGRGERIELDWDRMQAGTQDLEVEYEHPYLFRTPFGLQGGLKLYRMDSSFSELEQELSLKYLFVGENYFRVRYRRKEWNLLAGGERMRQGDMPFADLRVDAYGMGFSLSATDKRFLPTKGLRGHLDGSVGRKRLTKEPPSFVDQKLLKDTSNLQYELEGGVEAFYPLFPRLILMAGFKGGWMHAPYLVSNELHRIGGHASLRGVNKEAIRASTFGVATLELRYLLEERSDLHLFFDGAYHEDRSGDALSLDRPFGFGVGSRFETAAGIFNIDYALGKRFDNPIQLRNGRVHFGFTSLF